MSADSIESTVRIEGVGEIAVDDGYFYITDMDRHQLLKVDHNGSVIRTVGAKSKRPGDFHVPNGLRLRLNTELYVCDMNNHRIQVFNKELELLRVIGKQGHADGCFSHPTDVDFDTEGNLYVVDCDFHRIQVLTPEGKHIRNIGSCGRKEGELFHPVSLAIHKDLVYVTDRINKRISVFNQFVATFGEGILSRPEGIAIDENGYVHVTDSRTKLITF